MNIAFVGSRNFKDLDVVKITVKVVADTAQKYSRDDVVIISGGATGVDTAAIEHAKELGLKTEIIRPVNPEDKLSYLFRNVEIITKSDAIYAFWDGSSKGTKFVIDYATARNKRIQVYNEND